MTKQELLQQVAHEAEMLFLHATKEEKNRLNNFLNPAHPRQCVYGLMTGSCASTRAKELMLKCTTHTIKVTDNNHEEEDQSKIIVELFTYEQQTWDLVDYMTYRASELIEQNRTFSWLTPIEYYIMQRDSKRELLLQYIKGEIHERLFETKLFEEVNS